MKKIFVILCLVALLLAGCTKKDATQPTEAPTVETETQPVSKVPEQVIQQDVSPLTDTWTTTIDKGQEAALIYYLQNGGDQEAALLWLQDFQDVTYPLQVTLELRADATYSYTVYGDADKTGLEAFAVSLYNGYVRYFAKMNNSTEEQAKDYMADHGMAYWDINSNISRMQIDLMYAQDSVITGMWEQNDRGLVMTGWCTAKFTQDGDVMKWEETDDEQFNELLPLTFDRQK